MDIKSFSRSLINLSITVGQNNFRNKVSFSGAKKSRVERHNKAFYDGAK